MTHIRLAALAVIGGLALAPAAQSQPLMSDNPKGRAAVGLLDMAFNQHKVPEAFDKYVGPTYSQSGGPDAKAATIGFLTAAVQRNPDFRYDFKRVLLDRDVAAVYAMVYLNKTDPGSKVVDFFRFEKGRIVEHWDVIQPLTPASGLAPRPPAATPPV